MKKIQQIRFDKIWGYEIWLHSPLEGKETLLEDGQKTIGGPLIKIIKANKPLSVQVHPDDHFAQILENQANGKSESWYILDHEKDSEIVIGMKTFDKEAILKSIKNNTFEDNLLKVKVHKGDFYNIPAGLVHGIGAGVIVFEVQQVSDVTYRYYDYNRLENDAPRELHIDKAIKVQKDLSWKLEKSSDDPLRFVNSVGTQEFWTRPTVLKEKSIVIDLTTYESYIGEKDETVSLNNYAVVSY